MRFILLALFILSSCATVDHSKRIPANSAALLSCHQALTLITHHSRTAKNEAKRLINKFETMGLPIHVDIGGEGRYKDSININPQPQTSTTGDPGFLIPNWIYGRGDALPLPSKSVHRATIENAPINQETIKELMRVLRPRSEIHLSHPFDYAEEAHEQIIKAFGDAVVSQKVSHPDQYVTKTIIKLSSHAP